MCLNAEENKMLMRPGKWYCEFDENGNCTIAVYDKSYRELLGFESEEEYANARKIWTNNIYPDDEERLNALLADCLSKHPEGMDFDIEYRMMTKRGYHWFHDYAYVTRREDGSPVRADGVIFDIQEGLDKVDTIKHEKLRREVLDYMVDHDDDPIELLKTFAERIRVLIDCDQVIYRDLEETRIMVNSPAIENTWSVPIEYCKQCEHFDAHHPMYAGGFTEMNNCQEGWQGIPVYKDCPIKSSLTRIVYCDGKIAGYLAIHYVQKYHEFTDVERTTLEEFARILSMSLSRYAAKKRAGEADSVRKMMNMLFSLSSEYDPIIVVEPESGEYDWYMSQVDELTVNTSMTVHGDSLYKNIGIDGASIIHPDDRAQFQAFYTRENMRRIAETGETQETENRWFLKLEGRYKWKYNKAVRMVDDEGKVYVVVGVIDTTEQKEKEEELSVKEIELARRTVLSDYFLKSYASAYYVDLKNRQLEVLRVLKGFDENLAGQTLPADELLAGYMGMFTHPEDRERVLQNLDIDIVRERLKTEDEINFIYRDISEQAPGTYRCTIIPGDDEEHAAIGFQNITEQIEELENQQNQLAEALSMAESANRAKTTFLNNMSHDIRTPMNAIIGYTGLAASHIDNKEQVQDYLSKISQSSDHLLSLINDVLDMSRIESGKMNLDEKPENLSDIIHTLRDIIQADIHSKQLDFYVDAVDVNDEDVICDKLRLNQVLLNVLSNAIKYTAAGGTVTMRVTEKTVKQSGYGSYEFSIKDNGMGMDEEFVKTIFDPFTRVKSSTVSGIQGTGLGMAITKNIIDMMGGRIDIASTPGKGTEVTIDFDFKLQSAPKAPEEIPELQGVRALVADDDSNTCLSICNMISDIGMRFEWCTSGKEAVIRAGAAYQSGDSFKVYIIDWIMPDMNGIETTRRIRKVIGDECPIIILTAYDWSDIEEEAREAGVTAFVSKPMFPSDLHRVLSKCIGKENEMVSEESEPYDFVGKTVLLVEDNEMNREIAEEILEEAGLNVETAEDGSIAVEIMKEKGPDYYNFILMDIQMPIMDGYEATKAIRCMYPEKHIPIVALSANAFEEDKKASREAGLDDHVAKPIVIKELFTALNRFN